MRKIGDLKISTKLLAGFIIVSVLTFAIGIIGIINMKNLDAKYTDLYNDYGKSQGELGQLGIAFENTRSSMKMIFIEQNDLSTRQAEADKFKGFDKTIDDQIAAFSQTINTTDGQNALNELKSGIAQYKTVRDQAVALALQGDFSAANKMAKDQLTPVVQKVEQNFTDTFNRKITNGNSLSDSYTVEGSNWIIVMIAIVAAGVVASIALGISISRHITRPLTKLEKLAECVAEGDLSGTLDINRKDEIGTVTNSVLNIQDKLNLLLSESVHVSSAAAEGNLTVRADASQFSGGFAELINGINDTVDAFEAPTTILVQQLQTMADGKRPDEIIGDYKGIYADLINSQNSLRFSLMELMRIARELSSHSLEGDLSFRGDTNTLKNSFAGIINEFNQTLDNIVIPLGKAKEVLTEMSIGNNEKRVEGEYKGDIKALTDAVNITSNTINMAVNETSEAITAISEGRLDIPKMREFRGSWNPISTSVNYMLDSLNDVMSNINAASEQVASGAREVSDGSQALSSGATEQASSIEEFSASITEISSQTEKNAQNAIEAKNIGVQSSQDAQAGNESMHGLLSSMDEIAQASANIS
ncbi:MAG: MCP four helix bundle domain-containing protein, partial [Bacillota bacterium]|nr:MCP four helix bundle domain-containing protein [Bacillota bacterium]